MASRALRLVARLLDLLIVVVPCVVVLWLFGDQYRPFTDLALIVAVVAAYEAATTALFGGTPGKRAAGLRVAELDRLGRPSLLASGRRGAVTACLSVGALLGTLAAPIALLAAVGAGTVPEYDTDDEVTAMVVVGVVAGAIAGCCWLLWVGQTLADGLGRGVADRAARTMVVPARTSLPIATRALADLDLVVRAPRQVRVGRVADIDVRMRARLRRLNDAPVLVVAVSVLAVALVLPFATAAIALVSSAAWLVLFVVDETRRIHRRGATPGHELAGLVVVSRRTGLPPTVARSFLRATTLGLTLYVPLLWPVLAFSLLGAQIGNWGRALHDVVAGTVVIADPALDPAEQRQRAMRMRMGQVA